MTRLGSPAGSFVQSPARAFLQEAGEPQGLRVRCDTNLGGLTWSPPNQFGSCDIGQTFGGGTGSFAAFDLSISIDQGPFLEPTLQQFLDFFNGTTWTGNQSGISITFETGSFDCTDSGISAWIPGATYDRVQYNESGVQNYSLCYLTQDMPAWQSGETFIQS